MSEEAKPMETWAVVELLGHRRLGGYVRQVEMFGTALLRIDIPGEGGAAPVTQFYSGASLYGLTPCTEEAARAVARCSRPEPVHPYELPERPALPDARRLAYDDVPDMDDGDRDDDDDF